WRTRQIEHLMISILLSSRVPGVRRARQSAVRRHSTPPDHGEKSIIATIANPIRHASAPVAASIRPLGPQNRGIVWRLPHDAQGFYQCPDRPSPPPRFSLPHPPLLTIMLPTYPNETPSTPPPAVCHTQATP